MSTLDTLPIILLSTANEASATALIADLIDNDVTADYHSDTQSDRVWRLVNKYYTANVRVHPLTDDGRLDVNLEAIEAHIIHISEEELKEPGGESGVAAASARAARSAGAWRRAAVRLLLLDAGAAPRALRGWAARARAAPVPRAAPPGEDARAALHAHAWPGLRRAGAGPRAPPPAPASSSSCSEDEEAGERRAVEHAEAFAAALGALGPALAGGGAGAGGGGADEPDEARLERAEALVVAFCRALGYNLDAC